MARAAGFNKIRLLLQLSVLAEKSPLANESFVEGLEEIRWNRRQILKRSLEVAATLPLLGLAACVNQQVTKKDSSSNLISLRKAGNEDPVVIIGAGTAGLTAAYRLRKAGVPCVIYEASARVGGRMFTQHDFNSDGMFCERGGEWVDTNHTELIQICQELGLPLQSVQDADPLRHEIFFIHGKFRSEQELLREFRPLAKHLASDLQKIFGTSEVEVPHYLKPFQSLPYDRLSVHEYLNSKQSDVARWVLDLVEICYKGEFGLETDQQSALNLLCQIDAHPKEEIHLLGLSDESLRIQGGNSALPERLKDLLQGDTVIQFEHELLSIREQGRSLALSFSNQGRTIDVKATQVISAIPFTILRGLDGLSTLGLSPRKMKCIRELGYGSNAKMVMGFKNRYWRGKSHHKSNGVIYSDTPSQEFWETSRQQPGQRGIITSFVGGYAGRDLSGKSVQRTLNDFAGIFPGGLEDYDHNFALQHWPSAPFVKASYICPQPGQYNELIGSAGEPELQGRLLFAGEHTSLSFSGFMNGAVNSGNRVAEEVLQLREKKNSQAKSG